MVHDLDAFCFAMQDGAVLGAGPARYEGALASILFDDRLASEDGGIT